MLLLPAGDSPSLYHVASGTPVAAILRPARTPKGTEARCVVKHVTKHLRQHWMATPRLADVIERLGMHE